MSICCHYDDGYADGVAAGNVDGMADGLADHVDDVLTHAIHTLYAADPLSIVALECEQARAAIRDCQRKAVRR